MFILLIFYCAASKDVGLGHLSRCIQLSQVLKQRYKIASYFVASSAYVESVLTKKKIPFFTTWRDVLPQQIFVLDVVTMSCFHDLSQITQLLHLLKDHGHRIVFIDGLDEHSFLSTTPSIPELELAVIPYIGAQTIPNVKVKTWLVGSKYVLISPIYQGSDLKTPEAHCRNILITMGGSDPFNLTLQVLDALEDVELHCRIIIGPLFSEYLKEQIEHLVLKRSNWNILVAPSDLLEQYRWSDLVISSVGVSTYEVLAMRKPSIQISISSAHAKHGWDLHRMQLIYHVGYYRDLSKYELEIAITSVINSREQRELMLSNARKIVDSQGALYVADAIYHLNQAIA